MAARIQEHERAQLLCVHKALGAEGCAFTVLPLVAMMGGLWQLRLWLSLLNHCARILKRREDPYYPRWRYLLTRASSRSASRLAMASRLSYCFLPRQRPSSTLSRLPLKYIFSGTSV